MTDYKSDKGRLVKGEELLAILTADEIKLEKALKNKDEKVAISPASVEFIKRLKEGLGEPPKELLIVFLSGLQGAAKSDPKLVEKTRKLTDDWIEEKGLPPTIHAHLAASQVLQAHYLSITEKRGTTH